MKVTRYRVNEENEPYNNAQSDFNTCDLFMQNALPISQTSVFICLSLLLFLNLSCSKKGDGQILEVGQTIPILFDPDIFPPLDSFISEITVIPLETNDDCLLRELLQGVKVHQDLIYINNMNRELYVFDMNGKFIREIGGIGQGPGEFLYLHDFIFTREGTIELLDYQKIECYTLDGKYIETKRFNTIREDLHCNANSFCRSFSSGYYLWGGMMDGGNPQRHEKANLLYRLNGDMQIEAGFFDTKFGDAGNIDRFKYYQDRILFTLSSVDYNIYQIHPNDSLSIRYAFDFGKYGIKVDKNDDKKTVLSVSKNYVNTVLGYHEADHFFYFSFRYKTLSFNLLYSKATGQSYINSYWPAEKEEMRIYFADTIYKDQLLAIVQNSWLKMDLERMSPENIKKWGLEEFRKLDDEDNPVLILYKTKFISETETEDLISEMAKKSDKLYCSIS